MVKTTLSLTAMSFFQRCLALLLPWLVVARGTKDGTWKDATPSSVTRPAGRTGYQITSRTDASPSSGTSTRTENPQVMMSVNAGGAVAAGTHVSRVPPAGYSLLRSAAGRKCPNHHQDRTHKLWAATLDECAASCDSIHDCHFFSVQTTEGSGWCIGCKTAPDSPHEGSTSFRRSSSPSGKAVRKSMLSGSDRGSMLATGAAGACSSHATCYRPHEPANSLRNTIFSVPQWARRPMRPVPCSKSLVYMRHTRPVSCKIYTK